jgi:small-conductance mechanosensitive channel
VRKLFYRVVGPPPRKAAAQVDQLRWVRRIVVRFSTPLAALACVVLIVVGRVYIAAFVVAVVQLSSIAWLTVRIRREERKQLD